LQECVNWLKHRGLNWPKFEKDRSLTQSNLIYTEANYKHGFCSRLKAKVISVLVEKMVFYWTVSFVYRGMYRG